MGKNRIRENTKTIEGMAKMFCSADWEGEGHVFSQYAARYFYSALYLIFKYFGKKSITNDYLTGFAIALALLEGVPGFWELTKEKIKLSIDLK